MRFDRFWRGYDWVARADLAAGWIFDWRKWLWGLVPSGGGITLLWAAVENRSPLDVWIAAVVVMAALAALIYFLIAISERIKASRKEVSAGRTVPEDASLLPAEFAADIPDVRVADDTVAWGLFGHPQCDKLLPLLEIGRINAWGRLGSGGPPLTLIAASQWTNHSLDCRPALGEGNINQTFFRPKSRPYESTYYDVHLNRRQLERVWPGLWQQPSLDRIPCTELLSIATAAGWDFTSHDSLNLIDLQEAVRQGGSDSTLVIWGKANKWTSESLMRSELLDRISPDHWKENFVHLFAATQGDNFNTYSWSPNPKDFGRRGYIDLHVGRSQATSWLHRDALSFKGKNKLK